MPATKLPDTLLRRLRQGNRFLITSHLNPDGDAIGSSLGLARILRRMGKSATVWSHDPVPSIYRLLPGGDRIHTGDEPPAGFPATFNAVIVMECPSLDRTGLEGQIEKLTLLNIDHHLGNQLYGAVNWVDSAAPSVGEMVFRLARALGAEVDTAAATCLYLTLVTDTGSFRYSNATEQAFRAAADLVALGAQPAQVAEWVYENQPEARLRLLAEMLTTLERHADGRIATIELSQAMMHKAQAEAGDAEGLINYPRTIAGVQAVAMFREREDGTYKVSMRSHGAVDVQRVALRHGGGGHQNAAACEVDGNLAEVRAKMLEELEAALSSAHQAAPTQDSATEDAVTPSQEDGDS